MYPILFTLKDAEHETVYRSMVSLSGCYSPYMVGDMVHNLSMFPELIITAWVSLSMLFIQIGGIIDE